MGLFDFKKKKRTQQEPDPVIPVTPQELLNSLLQQSIYANMILGDNDEMKYKNKMRQLLMNYQGNIGEFIDVLCSNVYVSNGYVYSKEFQRQQTYDYLLKFLKEFGDDQFGRFLEQKLRQTKR
jgi:hypothetical protein